MAASYSSSYSDDAGRLGSSWGHQAPRLLGLSIFGVIALAFEPYAVTLPALAAAGVLLVFVLVTWVKMREHDRGLCERCVTSMPLNASEAASRFGRRFWVAHSASRPRYLIPYMSVLIGSNFLMTVPGRCVWALVQCSMIYLIMAYSTHRKLQPWCPWCSDGGGGSAVDEPVPDLPRPDTRQLV